MSGEVFRRVKSGLGANTTNQLVTVLSQLILVPCMLQFWGSGLYAEWIVLFTIPSYFAIADLGIGTAAGNQICLLSSDGQYDEANQTFQSANLGILSIGVAVVILLTAAAYFLPVREWLRIEIVSANLFAYTVGGLSLFTLLNQQQIFFFNCFRSGGNASLGTYWVVCLRFFDFLIQVAISYFGGVVGVVAALCIWRFIATWLMLASLKSKLPWLQIGTRLASVARIRKLLPLGMSFMAFPVGNAMIGQGMILLSSIYMGPLAAVVLSTHRTIVNVSTQFMNVVNYAFWPELTTAYGKKDFDLLRKLHRHACRFSIWGAVTISALLFLGSSWIIPVWTRNKIETDLGLLAILLVVNLIRTLWFTSSVVSISTNQHSSNALTYLIASIATLLLIIFVFAVAPPNLRLLVASMIPLEVIMLVKVIRQSLQVTTDKLSPLILFMLTPPRNFTSLTSRAMGGSKAH